jgi:chorismate synthase
VADGSLIKAVIRNTNVRSHDYENSIPRPGHADYPASVKFGGGYSFAGGGPFSGRMTAPLCIAGGIALQLLTRRGITVSAKPVRIAGETDEERMKAAILAAKAEGDSVGGVIECTVEGLPPGVGDHMFYGLENRIAQAVFGIPAVKGIEFGAGFAAAEMKGSENNDAYRMVDGEVKTLTNHAGGVLGGMSTGAPVVFRVAMKPTPSIYKPQLSVDLKTMRNVEFTVKGRHDPCVVLRAVPCVEAAAAVALYDALSSEEVQSE